MRLPWLLYLIPVFLTSQLGQCARLLSGGCVLPTIRELTASKDNCSSACPLVAPHWNRLTSRQADKPLDRRRNLLLEQGADGLLRVRKADGLGEQFSHRQDGELVEQPVLGDADGVGDRHFFDRRFHQAVASRTGEQSMGRTDVDVLRD